MSLAVHLSGTLYCQYCYLATFICKYEWHSLDFVSSRRAFSNLPRFYIFIKWDPDGEIVSRSGIGAAGLEIVFIDFIKITFWPNNELLLRPKKTKLHNRQDFQKTSWTRFFSWHSFKLLITTWLRFSCRNFSVLPVLKKALASDKIQNQASHVR